MPFTELFSEIARSALMLLVAVLAIYLSLRLFGAIAKFVISIVVIAVIVYFIFFATDIAQTVKDAVIQLPVLPQFLQKGV